jgi:hypothetical protein
MISVKNLYNNLLTFYNECHEKYDLQNPFFCLNSLGNVLTWTSYQSKASFYTYEEYFKWVVDNNQYSLAIGERILIQVYFEQSKTAITKASMSFLPSPDILMGYFRLDMDRNKPVDYYHNSYHINFGYNTDDVRFTLQKFPYPSEFIKFSLFLAGQSDFKIHNKKKFFPDLSSFGESFSHCFDFVASE